MSVCRLLMMFCAMAPALAAAESGSFQASGPLGALRGVSWKIETSWQAEQLEVAFAPEIADEKINGWRTIGGRWKLSQLGSYTATEPLSLNVRFKASFIDTASGELIDPLVLGFPNSHSTWRLTWFSHWGTTTNTNPLNSSSLFTQSIAFADDGGTVPSNTLGVCTDPANCPDKTASRTYDYSLSFVPSGTDTLHLQDLAMSFTVVAGIPEPATWASLSAGLLMVGAIARRRSA